MVKEIKIETPENIEFSYTLAGIGSRFQAAFIDTFIQTILLVIIVIIAYPVYVLLPNLAIDYNSLNLLMTILVAILIILAFVILWGYHVYFEVTWQGQTPGKKASNIRVIKDSGQPIKIFDSLIRNLIRIIDYLPPFYGIGILSVVLNKHNKRLGDLVAGTIVVKEQPNILLPVIQEIEETESSDKLSFLVDISWLTGQEAELVSSFIHRRSNYEKETRQQWAEKIALPLSVKAGLTIEEEDYELFLERIARLAVKFKNSTRRINRTPLS